MELGGTSMKEVRGASFAGSSPPFLGRERATVNAGVDPERRSPRHHETCLALQSVEKSSPAVRETASMSKKVAPFVSRTE